MFIPKHGVIYCSNNCLKYKSSSGNNAMANGSLQRNQQTGQNASAIVGTYLNTPQIKLNLMQQQQKQQSPLCSPGQAVLSPNKVNRQVPKSMAPYNSYMNNASGELSQSVIEQQLANSLTNQSRSRKPFTYPIGSDYVDMGQHNQLQQSPKNPNILKVSFILFNALKIISKQKINFTKFTKVYQFYQILSKYS